MYIQRLIINSKKEIIRDIRFHAGLNLIVDKTSKANATGNSVGKTTLLKLIDFCLGANHETISKNSDEEMDSFIQHLKSSSIIISLCLVDCLKSSTKELWIRRSLLDEKVKILEINGKSFRNLDQFKYALREIIFNNPLGNRPSFRDIISHNLRLDDNRISSTLKTIHPTTPDSTYYLVYLFMFGCDYDVQNKIVHAKSEKKIEDLVAKRLSCNDAMQTAQMQLQEVSNLISNYKDMREKLTTSKHIAKIHNSRQAIKNSIIRLKNRASEIKLKLRLIQDAYIEISNNRFELDTSVLKSIYKQANSFFPDLHVKFEQLLEFHNQMINNRKQFIQSEIEEQTLVMKKTEEALSSLSTQYDKYMQQLSTEEISKQITEIDSKISKALERKGSIENTIESINIYNDRAKYWKDQVSTLKNVQATQVNAMFVDRIAEFNKIFSPLFKELYGEDNHLEYVESKEFPLKFAINSSSAGKKQGESFCFDLAYATFAQKFNIPCLFFSLCDKKELMHSNQLLKISQIMSRQEFQLIASMLYDKLPESLSRNIDDYAILYLSSDDKLFKC